MHSITPLSEWQWVFWVCEFIRVAALFIILQMPVWCALSV